MHSAYGPATPQKWWRDPASANEAQSAANNLAIPTDRMFGMRKRAASGEQEFDRPCGALGTGHRLTPPGSPRTIGMVERFNGRIEEVLRGRHFRSGEKPGATLHRPV